MPTPRLPAEWEPQSGVIITWPHQHSDWADSLTKIEKLYLQLAQAITEQEKLVIIAYDQQHQHHIAECLNKANINPQNIIFSQIKTNDTWVRDYGPITLDKHNNHILDFRFNGWGNKFDATLDNMATTQLVEQGILKTEKMTSAEFILEGGSIESDGKGSLLTTSACLLTETRNTLYSKENITHILETTLGINNVLWLDHGYLAGDDTDSHIDMLARFTDPQTIVYVKCEDPCDEHFESSLAMEKQLQSFRNWEDKPYKLIPLPFPAPVFDDEGRRLPASYANFLIINHAVLVPVYGDKNDSKALEIIAQCFPGRKITGIPFSAAIEQNGSLHCLTMQIPQGYL